MGFDDALDAFGVHAIGGIVGGIAVGFFATSEVAGAGYGDQAGDPIMGVYYGSLKVGGHQLGD
jgi:Amt family ammonium transporter